MPFWDWKYDGWGPRPFTLEHTVKLEKSFKDFFKSLGDSPSATKRLLQFFDTFQTSSSWEAGVKVVAELRNKLDLSNGKLVEPRTQDYAVYVSAGADAALTFNTWDNSTLANTDPDSFLARFVTWLKFYADRAKLTGKVRVNVPFWRGQYDPWLEGRGDRKDGVGMFSASVEVGIEKSFKELFGATEKGAPVEPIYEMLQNSGSLTAALRVAAESRAQKDPKNLAPDREYAQYIELKGKVTSVLSKQKKDGKERFEALRLLLSLLKFNSDGATFSADMNLLIPFWCVALLAAERVVDACVCMRVRMHVRVRVPLRVCFFFPPLCMIVFCSALSLAYVFLFLPSLANQRKREYDHAKFSLVLSLDARAGKDADQTFLGNLTQTEISPLPKGFHLDRAAARIEVTGVVDAAAPDRRLYNYAVSTLGRFRFFKGHDSAVRVRVAASRVATPLNPLDEWKLTVLAADDEAVPALFGAQGLYARLRYSYSRTPPSPGKAGEPEPKPLTTMWFCGAVSLKESPREKEMRDTLLTANEITSAAECKSDFLGIEVVGTLFNLEDPEKRCMAGSLRVTEDAVLDLIDHFQNGNKTHPAPARKALEVGRQAGRQRSGIERTCLRVP